MRRRILALVIGMTTLVVLALAIPIAFLISKAVANSTDDAARAQAQNIAFYLRDGNLTGAQIARYVKEQEGTSGRSISVLCPDGTLKGSTPADSEYPGRGPNRDAAPAFPAVPAGDGDDGSASAPNVELRAAAGGQVAQARTTGARGTYLVQVFESAEERNDASRGYYLLLVGVSAGLLVVSAVAGEILSRRMTRPLVRTAHTAQQLSVGETAARAPTDGPREVAAVGVALNRLADRIDELIAEERETVADLSHRLRTPLTALRLDAEALHDPAEADRVGGHVSALERTLTAVIHAARRPEREGRMPSCDATEVVGERVAFWSALTEDQGRHSTVDLPDVPVPVRAAAEDLATAVDALLENIVAHTPEGSGLAIRLRPTTTGASLRISDEGPGIPTMAEMRGRSDRGSSGLGLDIARRCAESSGGTMTIGRAPGGGGVVTLDLTAP